MSLDLLKIKKIRNYFFADLISNMGVGMTFIGINWYVLEITGENAVVGKLMSIGLFSSFIGSIFAGTIADRFNRRSVMIFLNLIRATILSVIILLLYIIEGKNLFLIYSISALAGAGWTLFLPASRGLIQEIFAKKDLIKGNSILEISMQVGMFVAGGACGFAYKYLGFSTILAINALTFLVSALFLLQIDYKPIEISDRHESFFIQFKNGLKYLQDNTLILAFGIAFFIPLVATICLNTVIPGYVKNHLNAGSIVFGLADMSYGVGAFVSGFIAASLINKFSKSLSIYMLFVLSILSMFFLFFNKTIAGLYIALLFFGYANSSLKIIMQTIAMEIIPKTHFGRAMAVFMAISAAMQIASVAFVGKIIDVISNPFGFICLSAIMIFGFISVLLILPSLIRQNFREVSNECE